MAIHSRRSNLHTGSMLKQIKLPDLLSVCNALFGFSAILFVLTDESEKAIKTALVFILVAAVIDGLDGLAARTIESSLIGKYLDSLADLISFGVAPAIVAFALYKNVLCLAHTHVELISAFCGAYVVCGMLRLARFDAKSSLQRDFEGLPITGSAIFLASFLLLALELDLPGYPYVLIILMAVLCLLMTSGIRYIKLRDNLVVIAVGIGFSSLFLLYATSLQLFVYPTAVIVALSALYISSPVIRHLLNWNLHLHS